jgi:hypothetical protein
MFWSSVFKPSFHGFALDEMQFDSNITSIQIKCRAGFQPFLHGSAKYENKATCFISNNFKNP